jgi:hypothetical protein
LICSFPPDYQCTLLNSKTKFFYQDIFFGLHFHVANAVENLERSGLKRQGETEPCIPCGSGLDEGQRAGFF